MESVSAATIEISKHVLRTSIGNAQKKSCALTSVPNAEKT